jgi:hypothetical protein
MVEKSWTLVVSVAINISMQLCFFSVHGPRETYFVDEPRTVRAFAYTGYERSRKNPLLTACVPRSPFESSTSRTQAFFKNCQHLLVCFFLETCNAKLSDHDQSGVSNASVNLPIKCTLQGNGISWKIIQQNGEIIICEVIQRQTTVATKAQIGLQKYLVQFGTLGLFYYVPAATKNVKQRVNMNRWPLQNSNLKFWCICWPLHEPLLKFHNSSLLGPDRAPDPFSLWVSFETKPIYRYKMETHPVRYWNVGNAAHVYMLQRCKIWIYLRACLLLHCKVVWKPRSGLLAFK